MKTEVYSWRVSAEVKSELEREARRRKLSVSAVLDQAAREWLSKSNDGDDQEQSRLHAAASQWIGAFTGSDPSRSENARHLIRNRLRRRHGS